MILALLMAALVSDGGCDAGVYAAPGEQAVVLTNPEAGPWRYTFLDGRKGDLGGLVSCVDGRLMVQSKPFEPVPLKLTPSRFRSGKITLAGLLVEPAAPDAKMPLVVLVHGSEKTRAIRGQQYPYSLAAQGVAAFVYDKRGTGGSEGKYTQDFSALADDAAAAYREAKRLSGGRASRFGFLGGSQGGWIAPAAAAAVHPDFVIASFGLIVTPLEEDEEKVADELKRAGYDSLALQNAKMVTDATGALIASHFTKGFAALEKAEARFRGEPWYAKIEGEYTGEMLKMSIADLRKNGRSKIDNLQLIWRYDAMKVMRGLDVPQLWILAGEDTVAPNWGLTRTRLALLRAEKKPISVVTFPHTDHGINEVEVLPDGTRKSVRLADGYLRLLADWIKGTVKPPYGSAVFE